MSTYARGRLEMELREIVKNPPANISFGALCDGDVFKLQGIIMGPIGTPYEGGIFHLSLEFPSDYPFGPPEVKFLTKIYHPNVDEDGKINYLNILGEQWTPALSTEALLLSISSMLLDPIFLGYPEISISDICQNYELYYMTAREWTQKYAMCEFPLISPVDQSLHSEVGKHSTSALPDDQSLLSEIAKLSVSASPDVQSLHSEVSKLSIA